MEEKGWGGGSMHVALRLLIIAVIAQSVMSFCCTCRVLLKERPHECKEQPSSPVSQDTNAKHT